MTPHKLGQCWLPVWTNGRRDGRYKITLMWCGYDTPRYVRFYCENCKESYATLKEATDAAMSLRAAHMAGIREYAA